MTTLASRNIFEKVMSLRTTQHEILIEDNFILISRDSHLPARFLSDVFAELVCTIGFAVPG